VKAGLAAAALAGCQSIPADAPSATASLQPGNNVSGKATFHQMGDKVHVVALVSGLTPGREHGFHIHDAGDCSSGDGMGAKGHFNPLGRHPGTPERHAGDMPALKADL
jgi:superoxide dismutase, Cu-Zn family